LPANFSPVLCMTAGMAVDRPALFFDSAKARARGSLAQPALAHQ
jgi:hypothetical protein